MNAGQQILEELTALNRAQQVHGVVAVDAFRSKLIAKLKQAIAHTNRLDEHDGLKTAIAIVASMSVVE